MRIYIIPFILTSSLYLLLSVNIISKKQISNPESYYDDYFKNNYDKYNKLPSNDLNNNGCNDNCKINDFHHYFDDYDYYNNYSDFQYYDKKDDYNDHKYYNGNN